MFGHIISAMELKASRNGIDFDVGVSVCPNPLVFRDVCSEKVQNHGSHVVAESGRYASLVDGKPVLVSCKTQPFLQEGFGCRHGIARVGLKGQGSLLVHLGIEEAGQNGNLGIGSVGGEWNRQCLFGVLPLVRVE